MSMSDWIPADILAYERAIKMAHKQDIKAEAKRRRKLDRLFERLHGCDKEK